MTGGQHDAVGGGVSAVAARRWRSRRPQTCHRCGGRETTVTELGTRAPSGRYTVQRFAPKSPPYVPRPTVSGRSPWATSNSRKASRSRRSWTATTPTSSSPGHRCPLVATEPVPRFRPPVRTDGGALMSDSGHRGAGLSKFGRQPGVPGARWPCRRSTGALADAELSGPTSRSPSAAATAPGLPTPSSPNSASPASRSPTSRTAAPPVAARCLRGQRDPFRAAEIALAVGFDKHPRGAFDPHARGLGPARRLRRGRADGDHPVLRDQDRALHARARHHRPTLAKVAEKAYRNGALNPNAWRRKRCRAERDRGRGMVNDPLTRYMFCSPGEGARP